jgi:hypothetical protein
MSYEWWNACEVAVEEGERCRAARQCLVANTHLIIPKRNNELSGGSRKQLVSVKMCESPSLEGALFFRGVA